MLDIIWTGFIVLLWLSVAICDGYQSGHNQCSWPFFGLVSVALYAVWERPQLKSAFDSLREWLPQSEGLISGFTAFILMAGAGLIVLITVTAIFNAIGHGAKTATLRLADRQKSRFKGYF